MKPELPQKLNSNALKFCSVIVNWII